MSLSFKPSGVLIVLSLIDSSMHLPCRRLSMTPPFTTCFVLTSEVGPDHCLVESVIGLLTYCFSLLYVLLTVSASWIELFICFHCPRNLRLSYLTFSVVHTSLFSAGLWRRTLSRVLFLSKPCTQLVHTDAMGSDTDYSRMMVIHCRVLSGLDRTWQRGVEMWMFQVNSDCARCWPSCCAIRGESKDVKEAGIAFECKTGILCF